MLNKLFTYGTLMKGCLNENRVNKKVNAKVTKRQENKILNGGKMYFVPHGYPAVIKGNNQIKGEIITYDNPKIAFNYLDWLEFGYKRGKIIIDDQECWVYFWNMSINNLKLIKSGDWRKYSDFIEVLPNLNK